MKNQGFIATTTILIISAILISLTTAVVISSVSEGKISLNSLLGENNLNLVEGCSEDLLLKIHDNASFSGTTITRPEGNCVISYALSGPTNWDVTVTSNDANYQRKVRIVFFRTTQITITNWIEI
ncbi:MAG: hypothetical protein HY044_04490 [Candidatus Woesebacteria bacterium]|nr:MAG: hypothetical protein HY044_04490 [Candidatus Woesebacteria bacterium]